MPPQLQNPYSYVANNPLKDIDEKGESKISFLSKFLGKLAGPLNIVTTAYDLLKPVKGSNDQQLAQAYGLVPDGQGGYVSATQNSGLQCQASAQCKLAQETAQTPDQGQNQSLMSTNSAFVAGTRGTIDTGDNFGKLGTVAETIPGEIKGYSAYALGRQAARGVTTDIMKETVERPLVVLSQTAVAFEDILYPPPPTSSQPNRVPLHTLILSSSANDGVPAWS